MIYGGTRNYMQMALTRAVAAREGRVRTSADQWQVETILREANQHLGEDELDELVNAFRNGLGR
jgi:hypothetical protein